MTQKYETITMPITEYCEYVRAHNLIPVESHKAPKGERVWWELPKGGKGGDPLEAHIAVRPFDYYVDIGG